MSTLTFSENLSASSAGPPDCVPRAFWKALLGPLARRAFCGSPFLSAWGFLFPVSLYPQCLAHTIPSINVSTNEGMNELGVKRTLEYLYPTFFIVHIDEREAHTQLLNELITQRKLRLASNICIYDKCIYLCIHILYYTWYIQMISVLVCPDSSISIYILTLNWLCKE